jgi:hypothetical protein
MLKAVAKTATTKIAFTNFKLSRLLSPQAAVPVQDHTVATFLFPGLDV